MSGFVRTMWMRALVVLAMLAGSAVVLRAQAAPSSNATSASAPNATPSLARDQRRVTFLVAARAITRGDTLIASDLATLDTVITWRWSGAPDTTRAAAGWVARRNIAAGEVLRVPAVMPPPVITSGATVTAIWQDGALRVVVAGVATNTAALGAPVGVRIDRTRRLDGVAVGPNLIRLR